MTRPIDAEMIERIKLHIDWVTSDKRRGCQLDLSNANLPNLNFLSEDMPAAKFDASNLYYADLYRCVLASASFIKANLFHADFTKANLDYANFTDANLVGIRAVRASFNETNMCRANLAGADLLGADLESTNFKQAILRYADFSAAILEDTCLYSADLCGAKGLDTVRPYSIKIGSSEAPVILEGEEARAWLLSAENGGRI
jgi:uncharacterized protein YjbI with pentapeptide repeats